MSPRPIEFSQPEFEAPLRMAREGKTAEALDRIERVLTTATDRESLANEAVAALAEIARLAEGASEFATADRALALAIKLRPQYADLHYQHGCVLIAKHDRPGARRALDQALKLNPRYMAARVERSLLDAREGLIGEALDQLRAIARDQKVDEPGTFQQGLKSLERADWAEADSLLRRALHLADPEIERRLKRFHELLEENEPGRALNELDQVILRFPAYPDLHYLAGLAELKLGHFDDALASLARALELNPEFHDARVQFAHALECVGQSAQAGEQLQMVLQRDPGHRRAIELDEAWSRRMRRTASRS